MARIPLIYPKIPGSSEAPLSRCIAFEKYDGTNLHWVWDREFGWITFGTRRDSFHLDETGIREFHREHPGLDEGPALFEADYAQQLEAVFQSHEAYRTTNQATVFTEFFSPGSFAGMHRKGDPRQLILFDVLVDAGMIGPDQFVRDFGHLKIARVVYQGKLTGKFADDVRKGKYGVAEGVVCKGGSGENLWMVKIKTNDYMARLKEAFKERWEDYWE
jgi:hypothetical protein